MRKRGKIGKKDEIKKDEKKKTKGLIHFVFSSVEIHIRLVMLFTLNLRLFHIV